MPHVELHVVCVCVVCGWYWSHSYHYDIAMQHCFVMTTIDYEACHCHTGMEVHLCDFLYRVVFIGKQPHSVM